MRRLLLSLLLLPGAAAPALAHPVPSSNHDRTIVVLLTPRALVVDYRLEVDESRAVRDLPKDALQGVTGPRELYDTFVRVHATALANNLEAKIDGKPLTLRPVRSGYELLDHLRCDFRFEAAWQPDPDRTHNFTFHEANYELDDFSKIALSLHGGPGVTVLSAMAPDEALIARPALDRKPGDMGRLRNASAVFRAEAAEPPGAYKPGLPPDVTVRTAPESGGEAAGAVKPGGEGEVAALKPGPSAGEPAVSWGVLLKLLNPRFVLALLWGLEWPRMSLQDLLDPRAGVALLLVLAAVFGAAHALTPGHGKALVAAYLVGERGTLGHAVFLGLVVTLTHTGAVLVVAGLLPVLLPGVADAAVQAALGLVGGLLIVGLGLWLLFARLGGHADHVHLGGGHHHHHAAAPAEAGGPGWWPLLTLGISGGIVPCWDAVAMLTLAVGMGQTWLGLPLLLAFSAGLALVLVVIGVGVVYAKRFAAWRWGGTGRYQAVFGVLPIFSAAAVTGLGLWLCYHTLYGG